MELTGTIKLIQATQTYGQKGFKKREMVLTIPGKYDQHILIEFTQDNCGLLDQFSVGQNVKISININGREWVSPQGETKYFNSIQGWRIEAVEASTSAPSAGTASDLPF